jgi:hypothetical protein
MHPGDSHQVPDKPASPAGQAGQVSGVADAVLFLVAAGRSPRCIGSREFDQ